MANSELNMDEKWQMDAARKKIDPFMRTIVDNIDDAYYKGWKLGISSPYLGFDYNAADDNKLKFDLVSGIIHHFTSLLQHLFNLDETTEQYPASKYNEMFDAEGTRLNRADGTTPLTGVYLIKQTIRKLIIEFNAQGFAETITVGKINALLTKINTHPAVIDLRTRKNTEAAAILNYEDDTDY